MFNMGWSEMLVVGVVALIVVGPKDLPVMFRNIGRFVGKMRGMAREFSQAMNQAADESGIHDIAKTLKTATNPVSTALDGVKDAARDLTEGLNASTFNPLKSDIETPSPSKHDPDSETGKLSAERAEQGRKAQAFAARAAADRMAREAANAEAKAKEAEAALTQDKETET